jgi:hypothetical protein
MSAMPADRSEAAPAGSALVLLWGAFVAAVTVYALVALLVRPFPPGPWIVLPDAASPLELTLSLVALACFAAGFVLPGRVAASLRERRSDAGPTAAPEKAQLVFFAVTLQLALFEVPALIGLVLVVLAGPAGRITPFLALSLAGLLSAFPSRQRLERWIEG